MRKAPNRVKEFSFDRERNQENMREQWRKGAEKD